MHKHITKYIFISFIYPVNVLAVWGISEKHYSHPTLDRLYLEINNRYINLSTKEVAQRAMRDATSVARHFEQEFLTDADATDNESISDERKNRQLMKLLRIVYSQAEVSDFKVVITEFKEDIAIDLDNKEKALTDELNGYSIPKIVAGVALGAGLVAVGARINRKVKPGIGIMGCGGIVVGGGYLYSLSGRAELLKIHRAQVQEMKKCWEDKYN
jgi:hypothetical protein